MNANLSTEESEQIMKRIIAMICSEVVTEFAPPYDHYRILSTETRANFATPELRHCSLFDDVSELKKLAHDSQHPCTPVDLERIAAVFISLGEQLTDASRTE